MYFAIIILIFKCLTFEHAELQGTYAFHDADPSFAPPMK